MNPVYAPSREAVKSVGLLALAILGIAKAIAMMGMANISILFFITRPPFIFFKAFGYI